MSPLLITDEAMLEHDAGASHPERPDRLRAILDELRRRPVAGTQWKKPAPAPIEAIRRVHDDRYVHSIERLRGHAAQLDPDTAVAPGSVDAALLAAGAAIEAVTAVVRGDAQRSFALVRPPGHHAERDRAMGFCLFNNVAVAAEHARSALGCERVLIVDWDVHHGNGTQHTFEARRDVLVFNTHRWPFYPGTGAATEVGMEHGEGFTVNVPLPAALGDAEYQRVFEEVLIPVADSFRPDLVLVSAGFDPHRDDPLADMNLTEEGFAGLCGIVTSIADKHTGGRLAMILEGGYNLQGLARSVHSCVEVLAGATPPEANGASRRVDAPLREVTEIQRRYWKL